MNPNDPDGRPLAEDLKLNDKLSAVADAYRPVSDFVFSFQRPGIPYRREVKGTKLWPVRFNGSAGPSGAVDYPTVWARIRTDFQRQLGITPEQLFGISQQEREAYGYPSDFFLTGTLELGHMGYSIGATTCREGGLDNITGELVSVSFDNKE